MAAGLDPGTQVAIILGALGGAISAGAAIRAFLHKQRQREREDDALRGYVDQYGIRHPGIVERLDNHILDTHAHHRPTS